MTCGAGNPDDAQVDGPVGGGGRGAEEGVGGGEQGGHGGGGGGRGLAPGELQSRKVTTDCCLILCNTFLGPKDFLAVVSDFRSNDIIA